MILSHLFCSWKPKYFPKIFDRKNDWFCLNKMFRCAKKRSGGPVEIFFFLGFTYIIMCAGNLWKCDLFILSHLYSSNILSQFRSIGIRYSIKVKDHSYNWHNFRRWWGQECSYVTRYVNDTSPIESHDYILALVLSAEYQQRRKYANYKNGLAYYA